MKVCRECDEQVIARGLCRRHYGAVKRADPAHRRRQVDNRFRARYGITVDDYDRMLEEQGNGCAICANPNSGTYKGKVKMFAVDHDHETGRVRALLCTNCNTAIGLMQENPVLAELVACYLLSHGKMGESIEPTNVLVRDD